LLLLSGNGQNAIRISGTECVHLGDLLGLNETNVELERSGRKRSGGLVNKSGSTRLAKMEEKMNKAAFLDLFDGLEGIPVIDDNANWEGGDGNI